jgi:hypothetical protein
LLLPGIYLLPCLLSRDLSQVELLHIPHISDFKYSIMDSKVHDHLAEVDAGAAVANDDEHTTTVTEAFKRYPAAVLWAVGMSFTIGKHTLTQYCAASELPQQGPLTFSV